MKPDYFTSGRGRPYEAHPYKSPDKNDKERNRPREIDLAALEHPGSGPVNFWRKNGKKAADTGEIRQPAS